MAGRYCFWVGLVTVSVFSGISPVTAGVSFNPEFKKGSEASSSQDRCNHSDWKGRKSAKGKVYRIMDGDTIGVVLRVQDLRKRFSVRLLSIDTPETKYYGKSQGYWGEKASKRMAKLVPIGTSVTVEFDKDKCDRYGRMLGYVWKGNIHINRKMLAEGLAVNYCFYPNLKHCEDFARVTGRSLDKGLGFLGDQDTQWPYIWRHEVMDRPFTKYIGDIKSHDVYYPGNFENVDIENRVFFPDKSDIHAPYVLAH